MRQHTPNYLCVGPWKSDVSISIAQELDLYIILFSLTAILSRCKVCYVDGLEQHPSSSHWEHNNNFMVPVEVKCMFPRWEHTKFSWFRELLMKMKDWYIMETLTHKLFVWSLVMVIFSQVFLPWIMLFLLWCIYMYRHQDIDWALS